MKRVSVQDLLGRKIVKVNDQCVNVVTFETENGKMFMLETERRSSSFDLYGIAAWEMDSDGTDSQFNKIEEFDNDEVPTVRDPSCG